jgi:hypothetical protein
MKDQTVNQLKTIASELLPGEEVAVIANGEDYYTVEVVMADGRKSNFPPVWLPQTASEQQIKAKLSHAFHEHLHPESDPDDLTVPNLQTEGLQTEGKIGP